MLLSGVAESRVDQRSENGAARKMMGVLGIPVPAAAQTGVDVGEPAGPERL